MRLTPACNPVWPTSCVRLMLAMYFRALVWRWWGTSLAREVSVGLWVRGACGGNINVGKSAGPIAMLHRHSLSVCRISLAENIGRRDATCGAVASHMLVSSEEQSRAREACIHYF